MHDLADMIVRLCSHFCGQGRCFEVYGQALPVCQRCLGLYLGALVTLAWLIASGLWRRGLPGRRIVFLHAAALLTAGTGGLHFIDAGPNWRLMCGVLTGHVTIYWLAAGMAGLLRNTGLYMPKKSASFQWPAIQAVIMPILFASLCLGFGCPTFLTWWPLTMMACLGMVAAWSLAAAATAVLTYRVCRSMAGRFFRPPEKLTGSGA